MSAAVEHSYRYAYPSRLEEKRKGNLLGLATSGGATDFPYFFQGQLKHPRTTAQLLRVLSKVVGSRFHIPPAMLAKIIRLADPVVTSGGGLLRFEGFSGCCSTYARVDLNPDAYDGVVANQGTTNVDFNADMRAALAQVRDGETIGLAVGAEDVTLLRGAKQIIERKVPLPLRWLKGFVEVQAYQARMELRAELGKVETLRFLRSLPRNTTPRTIFWAIPAGSGVRLSQRESPEGVKLAGLDRLRLLEELAPVADGLRIYADPRGEASEWQLLFGPLAFHLTITAEVWRGFSGEGQVLGELATRERDKLLAHVRGALKWQAELRLEEFAANWDAKPDSVRLALAALGTRGLVGFDVARAAYFHRELPFDLELVEEMHPRLTGARKLLDSKSVKILRQNASLTEADVAGSDVTHRVRLTTDGATCTCPWYAKHQDKRGPCKHVLAVQIFTTSEDEKS